MARAKKVVHSLLLVVDRWGLLVVVVVVRAWCLL